MKIRYILLPILFFTSLHCYTQSADEKVAELLNNGDIFALSDEYPALKNKIQYPMLKALSESLLSDASNKPQEACEKIGHLLENYQEEIGFASVQTMFFLRCRNLAAAGKYGEAADRLKYFTDEVSQHMDSIYITAYKEAYQRYNALRNTPRSELIRPDKDCIITYETDTFKKGGKLIFVPVTIDGKKERFIFDTGCPGGAYMSERFAREHNVRVVLDSLPIQGVGKGTGKLGVADSIKVGDMILRNVTVTIAVPNAAIDTIYQIDAVLGQDIIKAAGEIQIYPQEQKIVFPIHKTPLPATGQNMIFRNEHPFLKTYSGNEKLVMHFDTGNAKGDLHHSYYNRHKDEIEKAGTKETKRFGGYGGVNIVEVYHIPYFPMKLGKTEFVLKNVSVNTDPVWANQGKEDGALGMDFISSFRKVIISFDKMFVEVEKE